MTKYRHTKFIGDFSCFKPTQGFTLLELMVASVSAVIVLVASLGIINEQQKSFISGRDQINVNNNLQTAMTLIGDDIKQAGERLEQQSELPVISIVDGTPTSSPDTILLQRKLISEALTICQNVSGSMTTVEVAAWGSDISACTSSASSSTIADVANLNRWNEFRCQQDGTAGCVATPPASCAQVGGSNKECMWAYIYDPSKAPSQRGEFFLISGESKANCSSNSSKSCWRVTRADGRNWQYGYTQNNSKDTQSRLYVLEQKEYQIIADTNTPRIDDFVLTVRTNNQFDSLGNPLLQRVTNLLGDMQFRIRTGTNTWTTDLNPNKVYATNWQAVTGIELTLKGLNGNASQLTDNNLTLQSVVYPRNATSISTTPSP